MDVWRICRARHEPSAFSGYGAEQTGGRWNFKGSAVVYTSENLSLAVLELFVHVSPGAMPADLISIRGVLPDAVSTEEIKESDLPNNWRNYPAPAALQIMGAKWLQSLQSLVLLVPSAVNPLERNLLLNPAHPEMKTLQIEQGTPFHFDPRMFGK